MNRGAFWKETGIVSITQLEAVDSALRARQALGPIEYAALDAVRNSDELRKQVAGRLQNQYGTPLNAWLRTRGSQEARDARLGRARTVEGYRSPLFEIPEDLDRPKLTWEDVLVNSIGKITDKGRIKGGHLYGPPVKGKSVCPDHWGIFDLLHAIYEAMNNPQVAYSQGDSYLLMRDVNGVICETKFYGSTGNMKFSHCVPLSGDLVQY